MTDFRTTKKFGSGSSSSDGYDIYSNRVDGIDIPTAKDVNSLANSIAETQKALVDGYAYQTLQPVAFGMSADNQAMVYDTGTSKMTKKVLATSSEVSTKASSSTTISTSAPLTGGGDLSANRTLSMPAATTSVDGYLKGTDFTTFNNKLTSPLITKGDLLTRDGSTHVRLPVGTDGQVLTADSTQASGLKFAAAGGGGSSYAAIQVSGSTIDVSLGTVFYINMIANTDYTFTNIIAGKTIKIVLTSTQGDFDNYTARLPIYNDSNTDIESIKVAPGTFVNFEVSFTSITTPGFASKIIATASEIGYSKLSFNGAVNCSVLSGNDLYIGGTFTGVERNGPNLRASSLDLSTAARVGAIIGHFDGTIYAITVFEDSAYFGGAFNYYGNISRPRIAKINLRTGKLDTTFNPGTGFNNSVYCLAIRTATSTSTSPGLYVGGQFNNYNGTSTGLVVKLNLVTGALLLNYNTITTGTVYAMQMAYALSSPNDGLYIGGSFSGPRSNFTMLNPDAATENSTVTAALGATPISGGTVYALTYDFVNNRIILGGSFSTVLGATRNALAAITASTGALDTSFLPTGTTQGIPSGGTVFALAADRSGIYVGGDFTTYYTAGVAQTVQNLVKVNLTTGALLTQFSPFSPNAFNAADTSLARAYGGPQGPGLDTVRSIVLDYSTSEGQSFLNPAQHMYIGGSFFRYANYPRPGIARVSCLNGDLDRTFNPGTGFDSGGTYATIYALALNSATQSLNSSTYSYLKPATALIVAGQFSAYRAIPCKGLAKINILNDELDSTFDSSQGPYNTASVSSLALSGTNLYVGGNFTQWGAATTSTGDIRPNTSRQRIAKVSSITCALDPNYFIGDSTSPGFNGTINCLIVNATYLFVGGTFTTYNNSTIATGIARFTLSTGALDSTFNTNANSGFAGGSPRAFAIDTTGLYAGGTFTTYGGVPAANIVKIDITGPNGGLPDSGGFDSSSGSAATVSSILLTAAGLYVGGNFTTFKGATRGGIARIDPTTAALDGAFVTTYGSGTGFGFPVSITSLANDSSGNIYVSGSFTSYGGTSRYKLVKLTSTGTLDATFDTSVTGAAFNGTANTLSITTTGLYVGGGITGKINPATGVRVLIRNGLDKVALTTGLSIGKPTLP